MVAGPSAGTSGTSQSDVLTLVPSEGPGGEVSYVLIVNNDESHATEGNAEEKRDAQDDLGVYDFDEAEQDDGENAQVSF